MTPRGFVYTIIGGMDISSSNLMKTVWGIADAAVKSGKVPGATKKQVFEGFWRDYRELQEAGKVLSLGEYLAVWYKWKVPADKMPVVKYSNYKSDPAISRRLPRGTDSGQWFIANNCFDNSPDGPDLLWLGRTSWEDGWTEEGDGDEMLETWADYVNKKNLVSDGPVEWDKKLKSFIWVTT